MTEAQRKLQEIEDEIVASAAKAPGGKRVMPPPTPFSEALMALLDGPEAPGPARLELEHSSQK